MSELAIATKLKVLSDDPANRAAIAKDASTIKALVLFLSSDEAVIETSLEALYNLSLLPSNRDLLAQETTLGPLLRQLMFRAGTPRADKIKQVAVKTYTNLQNHFGNASSSSSSSSSSEAPKTPLRESNTSSGMQGTPIPKRGFAGLFTDNINSRLSTAKTFTFGFTINNNRQRDTATNKDALQQDLKSRVDAALLRLKGVISFYMSTTPDSSFADYVGHGDTARPRSDVTVVVRAIVGAKVILNELVGALEGTVWESCVLGTPETDEEENKENQTGGYLKESHANAWRGTARVGKGSLVPVGSGGDSEAAQARTPSRGGWLGRIGRALWG